MRKFPEVISRGKEVRLIAAKGIEIRNRTGLDRCVEVFLQVVFSLIKGTPRIIAQ